MALPLNVVAHGNRTTAASGNTSSAVILITVTDSTGAPVTGLSSSDITIYTLLVAPFGANLTVSAFSEPFPAYYFVDVIPISGLTWKPGEFDVGVAVTNGGDHGQTITSFIIP